VSAGPLLWTKRPGRHAGGLAHPPRSRAGDALRPQLRRRVPLRLGRRIPRSRAVQQASDARSPSRRRDQRRSPTSVTATGAPRAGLQRAGSRPASRAGRTGADGERAPTAFTDPSRWRSSPNKARCSQKGTSRGDLPLPRAARRASARVDRARSRLRTSQGARGWQFYAALAGETRPRVEDRSRPRDHAPFFAHGRIRRADERGKPAGPGGCPHSTGHVTGTSSTFIRESGPARRQLTCFPGGEKFFGRENDGKLGGAWDGMRVLSRFRRRQPARDGRPAGAGRRGADRTRRDQ